MTASDEARKALEGVTPGPWQAESGHEQQNGQLYWQVTDGRDAIVQNQCCWCQGDHAANARFIAWAREGVPALLADHAAKDAEIAELRSVVTQIAEQTDGVTPEPENLQMAIGSINAFARAALKGDTHE